MLWRRNAACVCAGSVAVKVGSRPPDGAGGLTEDRIWAAEAESCEIGVKPLDHIMTATANKPVWIEDGTGRA